jgi:hypothetical protein
MTERHRTSTDVSRDALQPLVRKHLKNDKNTAVIPAGIDDQKKNSGPALALSVSSKPKNELKSTFRAQP